MPSRTAVPATATGALDDKGRCCGRKPMVYKSRYSTSTGPHRYCPRCDRAYDLKDNEQIPNWAWRRLGDGTFERQVGQVGMVSRKVPHA